MKLKDLSIFKKIGILVIVSVIAMSTLLIIGFKSMSTLNDNTEELYKDRLQPSITLAKYRLNNRAILVNIWKSLTVINANESIEISKDLKSKYNENLKLLQELKKANLTKHEKAVLDEINTLFPKYGNGIDEVFLLGQANKNAEGIKLFHEKTEPILNQIIAKGNQLDELNIKYANDIIDESTKTFHSAIIKFVGVFISILILTIIIGYFIASKIVNPVKRLVEALEAARDGDFTHTVDYSSKDEIGVLSSAFNQTTETLRQLIGQVQSTTDQLAAFSAELSASAEQTSESSEQIASVTLEVASGSNNQVRAVEETVTTVQNMIGEAQTIGNNSIKVNDAAIEAGDLSTEGSQVIQKAVAQMSSIHETIGGLSQVIHVLSERSDEIGDIVSVITNIADQTNLLALNAAIEAARVGEQGKGFAVVAAEVRELAEESADSAKEIAKLINSIQTEVKNATESMGITTEQVEIGTESVNNAGVSFSKIQNSINEVTNQIHEVSSSVQELVAGTEQIGRAVGEISNIAEISSAGTQNISAATEEQLATMEEIAASSIALSKMAEELKEKTSIFTV